MPELTPLEREARTDILVNVQENLLSHGYRVSAEYGDSVEPYLVLLGISPSMVGPIVMNLYHKINAFLSFQIATVHNDNDHHCYLDLVITAR